MSVTLILDCYLSMARVVNVFEDPRYKREITNVLGYDYVMVQLVRSASILKN